MNLIDSEDFAFMAEKWSQGKGSMEDDLLSWGIDPDAWEIVVRRFVAVNLSSDLAEGNPITFISCLKDGFTAGFQFGYLCALEVEMRRQTEP